jgi:hypothetical protein
MLAKRVGELPADGDWIFEPKWDGFRALVFRDGDEILIQSRDEKPLDRYFPELLEPVDARHYLPAASSTERLSWLRTTNPTTCLCSSMSGTRKQSHAKPD